MPLIRLEWDDAKIAEGEIQKLSQAVRDIVSDVTGIPDVFVYANSARIKVQVAPVEIFVEMSDYKIKDESVLIADIKEKLSEWKKATGFKLPINLTLIPMHWKVEVDI